MGGGISEEEIRNYTLWNCVKLRGDIPNYEGHSGEGIRGIPKKLKCSMSCTYVQRVSLEIQKYAYVGGRKGLRQILHKPMAGLSIVKYVILSKVIQEPR